MDYSRVTSQSPELKKSPLITTRRNKNDKIRSSFENSLGRNRFYDIALSPNSANLHPFHHSYVAGDQQHIADFVFNGRFSEEKTKMQIPLVPINTE